MRVNSKPKKEILMGDGQATKPTILLVDLLDRSGSMAEKDWKHPNEGTKYDNAIIGINLKLQELKNDNNADYIYTGVEFDTEFGHMRYTVVVNSSRLEKVTGFKGSGAYGGTPLYEAMAKTITDIMASKSPEERVLLNIYTDGQENESRNGWSRYDDGANKLLKLMEDAKTNHKFTITFVGTDNDVEAIIKNTGILRGNTYKYDGTARGMKMSMAANIGATVAFAEDVKERGISSSDDFYTKTVEEEKTK